MYDEVWFNLTWTEEDMINELEQMRKQIQDQMWADHLLNVQTEA